MGAEGTHALTIRQQVDALALPERPAVREMAARVAQFLRRDEDMTLINAVALAHVALAHGLDPFNNEIYWSKKIGVYIGIQGLRKLARQQSPYTLDFRTMDATERAAHRVADNSQAVICSLYRHDRIKTAVEINRLAETQVIPIKPIEGIGIFGQGDRVPKSKSPLWVAKKRAETEALRMAFDVDFVPVQATAPGGYYEGEGEEEPEQLPSAQVAAASLYGGDVIDGEMTEIDEREPEPEPEPEQQTSPL